MASSSVKVKRKNPRAIDKVKKKYKNINQVLKVGFPKELVGSVVYPSTRDAGGKPPRVIDVAAKNEFGSASEKIPPRPFMRESSKPATKLMKQQEKKLIIQLNKKTSTPDVFTKFLRLMGPKMAAIFQKSIVDLREPPNSPVTIVIKGSDNPLIDTGLMRQTLTYLVTARKKSKGG